MIQALNESSSGQDRLLADLQRLEKGGRDVPRLSDVVERAQSVKQHEGFFREDVRVLLGRVGLAHIEQSDVKDAEPVEDVPDQAAEFADK